MFIDYDCIIMTSKRIEEHWPEFDRPDPVRMFSDDWRVRDKYRRERYCF